MARNSLLTCCRVTVCLEGWCYLFLIMFVIGSAVVRDLTVLVLLTGMMIGAFIFHWRMVINSVREIDVDRHVPHHAFAGESVPISILVENKKIRLPSWTLVVEDSWQRSRPEPPPLDSLNKTDSQLEPGTNKKSKRDPIVTFPLVRGGESCCHTYHRVVDHRGEYEFSGLRVWSRFPIGLLRATRKSPGTADSPQSLVVYPKLGKLTMRWRNAVESPQMGNQAQRQKRGFSEGDYYGLREWRHGDSKRWVHWRTSAKLGELTVKQFEQQTDSSLAILLDLHLPPNPTETDLVYVELAVRFVASAVVAHHQQSDTSHVVLSCLGKELRSWQGNATQRITHDILRHLAVIQPHQHADELPHDWRSTMRLTPRDSLVIISTRNNPRPQAFSGFANPLWINVRSEMASLYFDPDE